MGVERWVGFFNRKKKPKKKSFDIHFQLYIRKIKNTLRHIATQRDMEGVPCQNKSDLQPPKA